MKGSPTPPPALQTGANWAYWVTLRDGLVKFRVLFALSLFLHLLVHPLVHAADMQVLAPATHASVATPISVSPVIPECAVCHIAGSMQVGEPVCNVLVRFDANAVVSGLRASSPHEGVESHSSPRAPPAW